MKKTPTRPAASPRKKAALKKTTPAKKPAPKAPARKPASKVVTKKSAPKAPARPAARPKARKSTPAAQTSREGQMADLIIRALEDLKAKDIVRLDVSSLTEVMDLMVIASGTSNRHVKSLADHARMEMKKAGFQPVGLEGEDAGEWVLVDFGGVVLHVMQPHVREFYDLERLWGTPQRPANR